MEELSIVYMIACVTLTGGLALLVTWIIERKGDKR